MMLCERTHNDAKCSGLFKPQLNVLVSTQFGYLGLLATPFGHGLGALALTSTRFGQDQLCSGDVDASVLPFFHPTKLTQVERRLFVV